jgi:hypothetical protein
MQNPTEILKEGFELRFFSNKVFGAWVTAYVSKFNKETITLNADYNWTTWKETVPVATEFYYPKGHTNQGDAFNFKP